MKTFLKIVFGLFVFVGLFAGGLAHATGTPCFNCLSDDQATITLKNRTQNQSQWFSPISANQNDQVAIRVYYHNSGGVTAHNTAVEVAFPKSATSQITTRATISADSTNTVTGTGVINVSAPATLSLGANVLWYHDGLANPTALTASFTETADERVAHLNLGDIESCWEHTGQIVFEGTLSGSMISPTVDLKINGQDSYSAMAPASYTLTWTSTNATSCSASNAWSGAQPLNGSQYYTNMGQGTYTYTITCTGNGGSASDSVVAYVNQQNLQPTVDLKVNGQDSYSAQAPASYTLTWTSTNANSCTAFNAWSGYEPVTGSQYYSNMGQGTYTYTITCTGNGGSASDSVVVYVNQQYGTAILSISKVARDTAITTSGAYYDNVYTVPGREIEFSISVANVGNTTVSNVYVQDALPAGLTYEQNTTTLDGNIAGDDITNTGVFVGSIVPGQTRVIKFRALVSGAASFALTTTQLINTASARADNASLTSDVANVWVVKGQVLGASTVDTGADIATVVTLGSTGFGSLMLGVYQIGRRMYWKNRIALVRKLHNG